MISIFEYLRNILLTNIIVILLGITGFGLPFSVSAATNNTSNAHDSTIAPTDAVSLRIEFVGKPIIDTLSFFRTEGFNIIFSTDLVKPTMLVEEAPQSTTIISLLNDILKPHGLRASSNVHQVILITAKEKLADDTEEIKFEPDQSNKRDEIIINQRFYKNDSDSSNASYVFTSDEMEKLPELTGDLFQSLKVVPNISGPEYSAKPYIRGGRENELKVILDGYEIDSSYHFENYLPLFSIINPNTIDSTELFIGGFSAEYGDRLSGVAKINSKNPQGSASHLLDMNYLSQSYQFASGLNDDHGSILIAARQGSGKELLSNVGNNNLNPSYYDLFSKLSADFSDSRLSWNTLISKDSEEYFSPGSLSFDESSRGSNKKTISWVNLELFLSDDVYSAFQVSVEKNNLARKANAFQQGAAVNSATESAKIGFKNDWRWIINKHTLKSGIEYKKLEAHYEYHRYLQSYFNLFTRGGFRAYLSDRDIVMDRSGQTVGFYISDYYQATDAFAIELGLRWDSQSYVDDNQTLIRGNDEPQLSPRLNIVFQLTDRQTLYTHAGRYYQSQRIDELSLGDETLDPQFYGRWEEIDPQTLATFEQDYQPAEKLDHYSLAYQLQLSDSIDFRAEVFSKHYDNIHVYYVNMFGNLQSLLPELAWDRIFNPFSSAHAKGFEFLLTGGSDRFNWQVAYFHLDVKRTTPDGYTRDTESLSPSGISINSYVRLSHHFSFSAWLLYQRGTTRPGLDIVQEQTNSGTTTTFDIDYEQRQRLDNNIRFDLRLSYHREWDNVGLTAFVGLYNTLGNDNPSDVFVTENLDVQPSGLNNKTLPAFGVTLNF